MKRSKSHAGAPLPSPGREGESPPSEHAADDIFRALAGEILRRSIPPGTALPSERELGDRFGVSRIVVREAVHRLKEHELVKVRQGAPTQVLDWNEASDPRLIHLELELAPRGTEDARDVTERQLLAALSMIALAQQRIDSDELDELERLVEEFDESGIGEGRLDEFEHRYWSTMAAATKNRILIREVQWWFNVLKADPKKQHLRVGTAQQRSFLYRKVNEKLREGRGAATYYLSLLEPVLAVMSDPESVNANAATAEQPSNGR